MLIEEAIKTQWGTQEDPRTWEMCFFIKKDYQRKEFSTQRKAAPGGANSHAMAVTVVNGLDEKLKMLQTKVYKDLIAEEV